MFPADRQFCTGRCPRAGRTANGIPTRVAPPRRIHQVVLSGYDTRWSLRLPRPWGTAQLILNALVDVKYLPL